MHVARNERVRHEDSFYCQFISTEPRSLYLLKYHIGNLPSIPRRVGRPSVHLISAGRPAGLPAFELGKSSRRRGGGACVPSRRAAARYADSRLAEWPVAYVERSRRTNARTFERLAPALLAIHPQQQRQQAVEASPLSSFQL